MHAGNVAYQPLVTVHAHYWGLAGASEVMGGGGGVLNGSQLGPLTGCDAFNP